MMNNSRRAERLMQACHRPDGRLRQRVEDLCRGERRERVDETAGGQHRLEQHVDQEAERDADGRLIEGAGDQGDRVVGRHRAGGRQSGRDAQSECDRQPGADPRRRGTQRTAERSRATPAQRIVANRNATRKLGSKRSACPRLATSPVSRASGGSCGTSALRELLGLGQHPVARRQQHHRDADELGDEGDRRFLQLCGGLQHAHEQGRSPRSSATWARPNLAASIMACVPISVTLASVIERAPSR